MKSGISKALRHIVFERDSYTCVLCENGAHDAHHVIPRSRGGRNTVYNLVSLCRPCHMRIHGELGADAAEREEMRQQITEYIADAHPIEYAEAFFDAYNAYYHGK